MADTSTQQPDNSQQSTSNAALQGLFPIISQAQNPTNPVTGLTDNHADILQGLLDKVYKQHAQDAINTVGPQQMQQLVDTHTATSGLFGGGDTGDSGTSDSPGPIAGFGDWLQNLVNNANGPSNTSGNRGYQAPNHNTPMQVPTGVPIGTQTQPTAQATTKPAAQPSATAPAATPATVASAVKATPEEGQSPDQYAQANSLLKQQALNEAKPKNWLQRFTDQFNQRTGGITQADRIANMQGMQKIVGGEQLQPKDIATFNSDQWKAGLDATKSSLSAEAQNMSNLVDLHGKLEATKGRIAQVMGWPSADQNTAVSKINESYKNVGTLIGNIKAFTDNPPQFTNAGVVNSKASDITNKIAAGVDPAAIAEARKRGLIK